MPFWATWESESKLVKGDVSPSWEVALWRQGSRQKHIIEGRSSVNEGSMHHGPQLLTLPWVTAKTLYIVLPRFPTLEYKCFISPWLRCTKNWHSFPYTMFRFFFCDHLILSETHQPTFNCLFNHAKHVALLHRGDLSDKRAWQPSLTHTRPTERSLLTLLLLFKIF